MAGFSPAVTDGQDNDGDSNIDETTDNDYPGGLPGIQIANSGTVQFTMDLFPNPSWCSDDEDNDSDGDKDADDVDECFSNGNTTDLNEDITYSLNGTTLMRTDPNHPIAAEQSVPLAYDIEAVEFGYAVDVQPFPTGDGVLDTDNGQPTGNIVFVPMVMGGFVNRVGAVKIWLLVRTSQPLKGYTDPTPSYQVGTTVFTPGDRRYKRMLLTSTVYFRNLTF